MVSTERIQPLSVAPDGRLPQALFDAPTEFGFFQAVRLLRSHLRNSGVSESHASGHWTDALRFAVNPSLALPASPIQSIAIDPRGRVRVEVNFLGLVGYDGVLPHFYSRRVLSEVGEKAQPFRDFLDLFHHRLFLLLVLTDDRFHFDEDPDANEVNPFRSAISSLAGIGPRIGGRFGNVSAAAPFLSPSTRGAVALEQLLTRRLGVTARVEQFRAVWRTLPMEECTLLDDALRSSDGGLGRSTVLGREVWDPQGRVRVILGPLSRPLFDSLLPGESRFQTLSRTIAAFGRKHLEFEVELVLAREDVQGVRLDGCARLGSGSWIQTGPRRDDAADVTFIL